MDLRYYWLREAELDGIPLIVSRTGWSSELGYELYLRDGTRSDELWEKIMKIGAPYVRYPDPHIHPSLWANGSRRTRFPVNAKKALATAGAIGGTPGSPTPVGV